MAALVPRPQQAPHPPKGSRCFVAGPEPREDCVWFLVEQGYVVMDSTSKTLEADERTRLRHGITQLLTADFVVIVTGWQFDREANILVGLARNLQVPILECSALDSVYVP